MKAIVQRRQESHQPSEAMTPLKALNIVESRCIRMSIKTAAQARKLFTQEADRLREETGTHFTKEELLSEEFYDINPNSTIRAVTDYFRGGEEEGWADCSPEARRCIDRVRKQLAELELAGMHPWKALLTLEERGANKKTGLSKKSVEQTMNLTQEMARLLLALTPSNQSADHLSWPKRIQCCKTRADFLSLFRFLRIPQDVWKSSKWLQISYPGLYRGILKDPRFPIWDDFKRFMRLQLKYPWTDRVSVCSTPNKMLNLIRSHGISGDKWQSSSWLQRNDYHGLYNAILKDPRFPTWDDFKKFMGLEVSEALTKKVRACTTKRQMLKLIRSLGIQGDVWQSTAWLKKNGHDNLYRGILNDPRFSTWNDFKKFMSLEVEETYTQQIRLCKTKKQMLKLIRSLGIQGDVWQRPSWLIKNDYGVLYHAIHNDSRFPTWDDFKEFMGLKVNEALTKKVRACTTKKQMLKLIRSLGIQGDEWQSSHWLGNNDYYPLYRGILKDPRFPTWDDFKKFMGLEVSEALTKKVKACTTKKQMLKLIRSLGIQGDVWQRPSWLKKNEYHGFHSAIQNDPRFPMWDDFRKFMGLHVSEELSRQVKDCITKKQMLALIRSLGIQEDEWQSSHWLGNNDYGGLYQAIHKDPRFPNWFIFLAFMDGRLPAKPIESAEQAQRLIEKEIRRLRSEVKWITQLPKKAPITRQEIETMLSDKYYKKNGVARAVADFYRAQEEQE